MSKPPFVGTAVSHATFQAADAAVADAEGALAQIHPLADPRKFWTRRILGDLGTLGGAAAAFITGDSVVAATELVAGGATVMGQSTIDYNNQSNSPAQLTQDPVETIASQATAVRRSKNMSRFGTAAFLGMGYLSGAAALAKPGSLAGVAILANGSVAAQQHLRASMMKRMLKDIQAIVDEYSPRGDQLRRAADIYRVSAQRAVEPVLHVGAEVSAAIGRGSEAKGLRAFAKDFGETPKPGLEYDYGFGALLLGRQSEADNGLIALRNRERRAVLRTDYRNAEPQGVSL